MKADSADVAQAFHSNRAIYVARALNDKTTEMVSEMLRSCCMCAKTTAKMSHVYWYLSGDMDLLDSDNSREGATTYL